MSYTGDQMPKKRKFDKNGNLIDPEDTLIDSLIASMNNFKVASCFRCKHLNDDEVSCKAFKNVIPREIIVGDVPHNKPYKGDSGVIFEAKD